jgi:hypothetical protein
MTTDQTNPATILSTAIDHLLADLRAHEEAAAAIRKTLGDVQTHLRGDLRHPGGRPRGKRRRGAPAEIRGRATAHTAAPSDEV